MGEKNQVEKGAACSTPINTCIYTSLPRQKWLLSAKMWCWSYTTVSLIKKKKKWVNDRVGFGTQVAPAELVLGKCHLPIQAKTSEMNFLPHSFPTIPVFCSNLLSIWKYQKQKKTKTKLTSRTEQFLNPFGFHTGWSKKKKMFSICGGEAKLHRWAVCQIPPTNHVSLLDESLSAFLLRLVAT